MSTSEISAVQIKLIHIGKSQLKLSDADYRALLREYDATSCKDLSYEAASALIDEMKARGFELKANPKERPQGENITSMVSRQQRMKLEHLKADINWRVQDGFERLAMKIIKKRRPTTSREASRMIEALKGLRATQQKKEEPF